MERRRFTAEFKREASGPQELRNRSLAMIAREALEERKSPKVPMQIKSG